MSVDVERDFAAGARQIGECGNGDGDIVADTAGFDYGLVRMLRQQSSPQMSNHPADIVNRRSQVRDKPLKMDAVGLLFPVLRALNPPGVRFPFYIAVVEVLAGLSVSSPGPLRRLAVDWTNILAAVTSRDEGENQ